MHSGTVFGAAFVPQTPLLVPEVAQGAAGELDELRAACRTAIARVTHDAGQIVVIGSGASDESFPAGARGSFAGFGVALDVGLGAEPQGAPVLPLSLTVGAWLVRDAVGHDSGAIGFAVRDAAGPAPVLPPRAAVIVVGDGSARHSTAAPGYLDDRAATFDEDVVAALRSGDASRLQIDAELGADLLVAGTPAWNVVARVLADTPRYDAEVTYDAAPYGVGYFVATWTRGG